MSSSRKKIIAAAVAVIVVVGAYAAFDHFTGNRVEIEQVITTGGAAPEVSQGTALTAEQLNGNWTIAEPSQVYFSVTTSRETVNISVPGVQGAWNLDLATTEQITGVGTVDLNTLDSGNAQRDAHLKDKDYLDTGSFNEAGFQAVSFEGLPTAWEENAVYPFKMNGTLTVKGISKDVTFEAQAQYTDGAMKLSGITTVTFDDFGMTNPHAVVLAAENNVDVRLELTLQRQGE